VWRGNAKIYVYRVSKNHLTLIKIPTVKQTAV